MTDVSLLAVAHGCPLLIEIILFWCDRITDVGVSALLEKCLSLKSMNTIRCGNISLNDLYALCKNHPRLRIVSAYDSNNLPLINTLNLFSRYFQFIKVNLPPKVLSIMVFIK